MPHPVCTVIHCVCDTNKTDLIDFTLFRIKNSNISQSVTRQLNGGCSLTITQSGDGTGSKLFTR